MSMRLYEITYLSRLEADEDIARRTMRAPDSETYAISGPTEQGGAWVVTYRGYRG